MEFEWAKYMANKIHGDGPDVKIKWETPGPEKFIATNEDKTAFSVDTGIPFAQIDELAIKLATYDIVTQGKYSTRQLG